MIRELTEIDLKRASAAEIADLVREFVDGSTNVWIGKPSKADIEKAADAINNIRKMPPKVRAVVASYLRSDELFCHQCGATSCIHGYPDY